ncbi:hypothetical protein HDU97_009583 [Phlyctochytrium planicorne]|nr:hypothetical protein HDU97_009583 [Phlyctochytrium planicorne]
MSSSSSSAIPQQPAASTTTAAANAPASSISPSQNAPLPTTVLATTSLSTSSTASIAATPSFPTSIDPTQTPSNDSSSSNNTPVIIGAGVGGGVLLLVLMFVLLTALRRRRLAEAKRNEAGNPSSRLQVQPPGPDPSAGFGYNDPTSPSAISIHGSEAKDAPTAAAMAAGLIPTSPAGLRSPSRASVNIRSPSVAGSAVDNGYGYSPNDAPPLPSSMRHRSQSFSMDTSRPPSSLLMLRRPSLPGNNSEQIGPQSIELISAYKDSDLAEKAFEMQRAHSLRQQPGYGMASDPGLYLPGNMSAAGSYIGSNNQIPTQYSISMQQTSSRRPSVSSVTTTGSMARAFQENMQGEQDGPEVETFSFQLESLKWVFARRASLAKGTIPGNETLQTYLIGGSASVPGGGWGVATDRNGTISSVGGMAANLLPSSVSIASSANLVINTSIHPHASSSPHLSATATLDSSTGRVVLMDTNVTTLEIPTSPMMDLLNDPSVPLPIGMASSSSAGGVERGGSSAGSLPRRPSVTQRSVRSVPGQVPGQNTRSVREQVKLALSWKDTSLNLHKQQPTTLPSLKAHPLSFLVASGERQEAWPTFLNQLSTVLFGLADLEDSTTPRQSLPDRLNDAIQELCVTFSAMIKSGTAIPARIGYEPRAVNEVSMKRHDVVTLLHRFDDDFGFGWNRTTSALGFVHLSHLDPRRLGLAVGPAPLPLPLPALPAHVRLMASGASSRGVSPVPMPTGSPVSRRPSMVSVTSGMSAPSGLAEYPTSHILSSLSSPSPVQQNQPVRMDRAPSIGAMRSILLQPQQQIQPARSPSSGGQLSSPYQQFIPPPVSNLPFVTQTHGSLQRGNNAYPSQAMNPGTPPLPSRFLPSQQQHQQQPSPSTSSPNTPTPQPITPATPSTSSPNQRTLSNLLDMLDQSANLIVQAPGNKGGDKAGEAVLSSAASIISTSTSPPSPAVAPGVAAPGSPSGNPGILRNGSLSRKEKA